MTSKGNPIRPIGSSVHVTCVAQVDLSGRLEIDVPLNMDVHLTAPTRELLANSSFTVLQSGHTCANTSSILGSFGRNDSGLYECTTSITSVVSNIFLVEHNSSKSVQITTGK